MPKQRGAAPTLAGSWDGLQPPISPWILDVIAKMGFTKMTPVQAGTIPRAIKNQDCVVEAVTGSGKTLAFVVPVLERLTRREEKYPKGQVASIIIAPTRELAQQIHDVFHHFLSSLQPPPPPPPTDPSSSRSRSPSPVLIPEAPYPLPLLVTSGTTRPYETFISRSPQIIIGTPGRLASFLLSPRGISLVRVSELDVLVLDEADRLLSAPDHRRDVERIMRHLPKQRRTHLFSATMTDAVEDIVGIGLRNPVRIVVNLKDKRATGEASQERRTPLGLRNTYLVCRHAEKTLQAIRLLRAQVKSEESAKFIIYFSTVAAVDYFYRIFSRLPQLSSFAFTSLHGDLQPRVRETALNNFTSHPASHLTPAVLLCTDVAARGVDFTDIDVVIQYDPPTDPKTFSHRAGRTARAGRSGKSVVLLGKGREEEYVDFLAVRKIPLLPQSYLNAELEDSTTPPEALDPQALELLHQVRSILLTDRELHDKAAKAFVSSLQAYRKHEASFIFRVPDLDMHGLAIAFGLLRLPAMPEIKEWKRRKDAREKKRAQAAAAVDPPAAGTDVNEGAEAVYTPEVIPWTDAEVKWDVFAYTSKTREAARLTALENRPARDAARDTETRARRKIQEEIREAWSEQKDRKGRKEERREKKDTKKQKDWERKLAEGTADIGMVEEFKRNLSAAGSKTTKTKRKQGQEQEEADSGSGDEGVQDAQEYKAMKREIKEERATKKGRREDKVVGGAFDDLD